MAMKKKPAKSVDFPLPINAEKKRKPSGKPFEKGNTVGFKPGQSGNPAGRPKGVKYFSEAAREWLSAPNAENPDLTNADVAVIKCGAAALDGDMAALRELLDRAEDKPRQAIDLSVEERRREMAERAIKGLMAETGVGRDAALEELAKLTPEIRQWVM
jgi:uncharacterized protein DUF5681